MLRDLLANALKIQVWRNMLKNGLRLNSFQGISEENSYQNYRLQQESIKAYAPYISTDEDY